MKAVTFLIYGCISLLPWGALSTKAETLSGKFHFPPQDILVFGTQNYSGHIDLSGQLPMGDDFVLSSVVVTFTFQDDSEWRPTSRDHSLTQTGKVIRHKGMAFTKSKSAGQTDHYYQSKDIIMVSNEAEVAQLTIGHNVFYGSTIRRREITEEPIGQKHMILGTYGDPGDEGNIRDHYRVTDMVRETRQDGFDGPFEIKRKKLDLASTQDLARTGQLAFTLGGQGDYIFTGATVQYQGYTMAVGGAKQALFKTVPSWFGLVSLPLGGVLWWRRKNPKPQSKSQKSRGRPVRRSKLRSDRIGV